MSNDFHIAPYREDGFTPGTSIGVWAVSVDDVVFVRTGNPESRWFRAAVNQRALVSPGSRDVISRPFRAPVRANNAGGANGHPTNDGAGAASARSNRSVHDGLTGTRGR